jgi:hypothetical protein
MYSYAVTVRDLTCPNFKSLKFLPCRYRMTPKPPRIPLHLIHPSRTVLLLNTPVLPDVIQCPIVPKTQTHDESGPVECIFRGTKCLTSGLAHPGEQLLKYLLIQLERDFT